MAEEQVREEETSEVEIANNALAETVSRVARDAQVKSQQYLKETEVPEGGE